MGKVGSSTVYYALQSQWNGPSLHGHSFAGTHPDLRIGELYDWHRAGNPIRLVSLTRDPIARNISYFFHCFKAETGLHYTESEYSPEDLKHHFVSEFNHAAPDRWFKDHIRYHFGIDVFESEFPDRGFETFERDNVQLIVLRAELDDDSKSAALSDFLQLPEIRLQRCHNRASDKGYSRLYREFLSVARFPGDFVNVIYSSQYCRHFYGPALIAEMKRKWTLLEATGGATRARAA